MHVEYFYAISRCRFTSFGCYQSKCLGRRKAAEACGFGALVGTRNRQKEANLTRRRIPAMTCGVMHLSRRIIITQRKREVG